MPKDRMHGGCTPRALAAVAMLASVDGLSVAAGGGRELAGRPEGGSCLFVLGRMLDGSADDKETAECVRAHHCELSDCFVLNAFTATHAFSCNVCLVEDINKDWYVGMMPCCLVLVCNHFLECAAQSAVVQ